MLEVCHIFKGCGFQVKVQLQIEEASLKTVVLVQIKLSLVIRTTLWMCVHSIWGRDLPVLRYDIWSERKKHVF
jgi:hypothetical protein